MDALAKYVDLLLAELQADMAVFHTAWVVYTVLPLLAYVLYAMLKWYLLLMPVTMPMTLWLLSKNPNKSASHYRNN